VGFLDRFRSFPPSHAGSTTFSAISESGDYKAKDGTTLWRNGYALVDSQTRAFLSWSDPVISQAGAMVSRVAGVSHRSADLQQDGFSPGRPLLLRPEPDNPHDRDAVGVWDESGRTQVGFVPRDQAPEVASAFRRGKALGALVLQELRASRDGERLALVLLVCPIGQVTLEVDDSADGGSLTGRHAGAERPKGSSEAGTVRGRHYTEYVEAVKELRREGSAEEAEHLLLELVDATEAEARAQGSGWGVAPWYYEQLAILYRRQGSPEKEVAILERFAAQPHAPGASPPKLQARLKKAKARLSR
jgi:hypothetical protein